MLNLHVHRPNLIDPHHLRVEMWECSACGRTGAETHDPEWPSRWRNGAQMAHNVGSPNCAGKIRFAPKPVRKYTVGQAQGALTHT